MREHAGSPGLDCGTLQSCVEREACIILWPVQLGGTFLSTISIHICDLLGLLKRQMPFGQQSTNSLNCVPQNLIGSALKLILAALGKFPHTVCLCKVLCEYSWQLMFRAERKLPPDKKTRPRIEQRASSHPHLFHPS